MIFSFLISLIGPFLAYWFYGIEQKISKKIKFFYDLDIKTYFSNFAKNFNLFQLTEKTHQMRIEKQKTWATFSEEFISHYHANWLKMHF